MNTAQAASYINQGSLRYDCSQYAADRQRVLTIHRAIFEQDEDSKAAVPEPILQCVQVKPLNSQPGAPERFRVVFSDVINFAQSMLATRE